MISRVKYSIFVLIRFLRIAADGMAENCCASRRGKTQCFPARKTTLFSGEETAAFSGGKAGDRVDGNTGGTGDRQNMATGPRKSQSAAV